MNIRDYKGIIRFVVIFLKAIKELIEELKNEGIIDSGEKND